MIVLGLAVIGVLLGAFIAWRRKGNRLDILHYAAGFGLAFVVVGMIATVVVHRMMV